MPDDTKPGAEEAEEAADEAYAIAAEINGRLDYQVVTLGAALRVARIFIASLPATIGSRSALLIIDAALQEASNAERT